MNGVIQGGWSYVWASYAITGLALLIYVVIVVARYRRAVRESHQQ